MNRFKIISFNSPRALQPDPGAHEDPGGTLRCDAGQLPIGVTEGGSIYPLALGWLPWSFLLPSLHDTSYA